MAVAKLVSEVEPNNLAWLEIEDEDGVKYRYHKRERLESFTELHVEGAHTARGGRAVVLVRENNGQVVLRQERPGLPNKIAVDWSVPNVAPQGPFPFGANWERVREVYEYEQE